MHKKSAITAPIRAIVTLLSIAIFGAISFMIVSTVWDAYSENTAVSQFNNFIQPIRAVCSGKGSETAMDLSLGGFGESGTYAIVQLDVSGQGKIDLINALNGKDRDNRLITGEVQAQTSGLTGNLRKCDGGTCLCLVNIKHDINTFRDSTGLNFVQNFFTTGNPTKGAYSLGYDRNGNPMGFFSDMFGAVESMQACQSEGSCLPPWYYEPMRTDWIQQIVLGFAVETIFNYIRAYICGLGVAPICESGASLYGVYAGLFSAAQFAVTALEISGVIPANQDLNNFISTMNSPEAMLIAASLSCTAGCWASPKVHATCDPPCVSGPQAVASPGCIAACVAGHILGCIGSLTACRTLLDFSLPSSWFFPFPQYIISASTNPNSIQWGWEGQDNSVSYDYGVSDDADTFRVMPALAKETMYQSLFGSIAQHVISNYDSVNYGAGMHFGATCDKDEMNYWENSRGFLFTSIVQLARSIASLFDLVPIDFTSYLSASDIQKINSQGGSALTCTQRKDGCVSMALTSDNCNSNGRKEGIGYMLSQRRYSSKYAWISRLVLDDYVPRNWRIELYNKEDYMLKNMDFVQCIRLDELGCDTNEKILVKRDTEYYSAATYINLGEAYALKQTNRQKWNNRFDTLMNFARCSGIAPYKMGGELVETETTAFEPGSGFLSCMVLMGVSLDDTNTNNLEILKMIPDVKYFQAWIGGNDPYGLLGVNSYIPTMTVSRFSMNSVSSINPNRNVYASNGYEGKILLYIKGRLS